MNMTQEFDHQVHNLIDKGYHQLAGISETELIDLLSPLKSKVEKLDLPFIDFEKGYVPFVIATRDLIPTATAMSLIEKDGKKGITKLFPLEPQDFKTIPDVSIPDHKVYVLVDIDRGRESINKPPIEAMKDITAKGRSPLTIDEGISLLTHYPEFLMKNNCFSLLASRHPGDQRVPAIWINGTKNPNLGWCWNGNPHTWLGSASCVTRIYT